MSYASSWGDGFDFKDLGSMIGLHGLKPMKYHIESNIGLHGWNGLGKAQGTNALAGALMAGGMYALPSMGAGGAGSVGAGEAGGAGAAGDGGMFSGLLGGSSSAAAPSAAAPSATAASSAPTSAGGSSGLLSGFSDYAKPISQGLQIGQQAQGLMGSNQQVQAQPQQQRQAPDMSGFIGAQAQQQAAIDAERQRRMQQQQMAMQGLLGGRNGIA